MDPRASEGAGPNTEAPSSAPAKKASSTPYRFAFNGTDGWMEDPEKTKAYEASLGTVRHHDFLHMGFWFSEQGFTSNPWGISGAEQRCLYSNFVPQKTDGFCDAAQKVGLARLQGKNCARRGEDEKHKQWKNKAKEAQKNLTALEASVFSYDLIWAADQNFEKVPGKSALQVFLEDDLQKGLDVVLCGLNDKEERLFAREARITFAAQKVVEADDPDMAVWRIDVSCKSKDRAEAFCELKHLFFRGKDFEYPRQRWTHLNAIFELMRAEMDKIWQESPQLRKRRASASGAS